MPGLIITTYVYYILQDKNGVGFSDFEIREEANNFIFGGHDTSASGRKSDCAVNDLL